MAPFADFQKQVLLAIGEETVRVSENWRAAHGGLTTGTADWLHSANNFAREVNAATSTNELVSLCVEYIDHSSCGLAHALVPIVAAMLNEA